jgi:hypothetical protein
VHAEREVAQAQERLARVQRAFQDGHLDPADYAGQRRGLLQDQDGAQAAVEQARQRVAALTGDVDVEADALRWLADLRATVLGKLDDAPSPNATRTLLRQRLTEVRYVPPGSPLLEFGLVDATLVGGGCLLPTVNAGLITGYVASAEVLFSPVVERVPFPVTGIQRASTSASATERIGLPM